MKLSESIKKSYGTPAKSRMINKFHTINAVDHGQIESNDLLNMMIINNTDINKEQKLKDNKTNNMNRLKLLKLNKRNISNSNKDINVNEKNETNLKLSIICENKSKLTLRNILARQHSDKTKKTNFKYNEDVMNKFLINKIIKEMSNRDSEALNKVKQKFSKAAQSFNDPGLNKRADFISSTMRKDLHIQNKETLLLVAALEVKNPLLNSILSVHDVHYLI